MSTLPPSSLPPRPQMYVAPTVILDPPLLRQDDVIVSSLHDQPSKITARVNLNYNFDDTQALHKILLSNSPPSVQRKTSNVPILTSQKASIKLSRPSSPVRMAPKPVPQQTPKSRPHCRALPPESTRKFKELIDAFVQQDRDAAKNAFETWKVLHEEKRPKSPTAATPLPQTDMNRNNYADKFYQTDSKKANEAWKKWKREKEEQSLNEKLKKIEIQEQEKAAAERKEEEKEKIRKKSQLAVRKWLDQKKEEERQKKEEEERRLKQQEEECAVKQKLKDEVMKKWIAQHPPVKNDQNARRKTYISNKPAWTSVMESASERVEQNPSSANITLTPSPPHLFKEYGFYKAHVTPSYMHKYRVFIASAGHEQKPKETRSERARKKRLQMEVQTIQRLYGQVKKKQ